MMKMRTTRPPARMARGVTIHQETGSARYMKYHSAMNGPKVFTICQMARGREGSWNFATICFHAATFFPPSFKSDIVQMRKRSPSQAPRYSGSTRAAIGERCDFYRPALALALTNKAD